MAFEIAGREQYAGIDNAKQEIEYILGIQPAGTIDDYDLDAIYDEAIIPVDGETYGGQQVYEFPENFWDIVQKHDKTQQ